MKKVQLLLTFLTIYALASAQSTLNYSNWQLVFQDEFNGYNGLEDLSTNWRFDYPWGPTLTGNTHENQYYTTQNISFRDNNIVFTAVKQDPPITYYWEENGVQKSKELEYTSGMLFSKVPFDPGCWDGNIGFTYGMFEIRCKMPKGIGTWPAFWLYSGPTEIDVFEFYDDKRMFTTTIHDWNNNGTHTACSNHFKKSVGMDLTEEFHNYACVWDSEKVRIFFDSVEVWSTSREKTHGCPATIIINLAMINHAFIQNTEFVVDYVRAYKMIDPSLPITNDYVWDKAYLVTTPTNLQKAAKTPNTLLSNGSGKLIYKGNNSKIRTFENIGDQWISAEPIFNYSTQNLVKGELVIDTNNVIFYIGKDNRIYSIEDIGSSSIKLVDDGSMASYSKVSGTSGSMVVCNGKIFYRGIDNKLHKYEKNGLVWVHQLMNIPYTTKETIAGNLTASPSGNIFYRGGTGRLNYVSYMNGIFNHSIIGETTIPDEDKVATGNATIVTYNNDIIFHAKDHTLKKYTWTGLNWNMEELSTSTNYPPVKASLKISENGNLYYRDNAGKLSILLKEGNQYRHEYPSSWGAASTQININNDNFFADNSGSIYFVNGENTLQKFFKSLYIGPNVVCDVNDYTPQVIYKQLSPDVSFKVFPNPAKDFIFINNPETDEVVLEVFGLQGNICATFRLAEGSNKLSIENLPTGMYLYKVSNGNTGKFVKN